MPWDDKESEGIANWATLMSDLAESTVPKTQNHTNFDLRPHRRCRGVVVQQRAIRGPNFSPTLPNCSSWAKLEPTGPSSAKVRPKLGRSSSWLVFGQTWAKDDQVWPQSPLVRPSRPAFFLSVLFPGCERYSARSDSNISKHNVYQCLIYT